MNNDIPYDYKHIPQPVAGYKNLQDELSPPPIDLEAKVEDSEKKDSRDYFNVMGHAQVNMDSSIPSSVRKSTEELFKNPELIQMQVDFCDDLIEKGYTLEDAIDKTDMVFKALKSEALYS